MSVAHAPSLLYLWETRTLFLGRLLEPLQLSQAAATFVISLDGPLHVYSDNTSFQCQSILLPPSYSVSIDSGNSCVANCYLDPFGEDFHLLSQRMRQQHGRVACCIDNESALIAQFRAMHLRAPSSADTYAEVDGIIRPVDRPPYFVDPRIARTIDLIKKTVGENLSVAQLAEHVSLSAPRLTQLFRQQIGVPIRRYRQWHRLYVTATGVASGLSLTDASVAAGFTDSSHFSHTFRDMLGMKPSEILAHPDRIRLFAG